MNKSVMNTSGVSPEVFITDLFIVGGVNKKLVLLLKYKKILRYYSYLLLSFIHIFPTELRVYLYFSTFSSYLIQVFLFVI